jgi:hypothetical protein
MAKEWSRDTGYSWIHLEEIQKWEDENYRIHSGELDYEMIISEQLQRLYEVRENFQQMNGEY